MLVFAMFSFVQTSETFSTIVSRAKISKREIKSKALKQILLGSMLYGICIGVSSEIP